MAPKIPAGSIRKRYKLKGGSKVAQGKIDAQLKNKRDQFVNDESKPKSVYIIIGVVAIIVMAALFLYASSKGTGMTKIDPREAKYIGRYLPAGYEPVKLTEPVTYDRRIDMAQVAPEVKDGKVMINAGDIISKRIIYFEYKRPADGQVISMMAYIKPSGKLFTGVSYCPPCEGKYHHLEADGTLTCNSCETKRDPETEAGISGACKLYPADEIAHELVDDKIQLAEADLAKWKAQPTDRPVGE
ncbi:MAG: DUF2318 domain-containing protein [Actinobacteria bacterium]|nr:DUF2318 domain-containing protein [Actinomycetota bacterium]